MSCTSHLWIVSRPTFGSMHWTKRILSIGNHPAQCLNIHWPNIRYFQVRESFDRHVSARAIRHLVAQVWSIKTCPYDCCCCFFSQTGWYTSIISANIVVTIFEGDILTHHATKSFYEYLSFSYFKKLVILASETISQEWRLYWNLPRLKWKYLWKMAHEGYWHSSTFRCTSCASKALKAFFYISVLNKYNSTLRSFRMLEMTHDSGYNRNPGLFLALHDNLIIWKTKQKLSKYFTPFPQLVTPLAEDLACWWSSFGWLYYTNVPVGSKVRPNVTKMCPTAV